MQEFPKLIFDFLKGSHSIPAQRSIEQLRGIVRTHYIGIGSRSQFIREISSIAYSEPFVIQIIAHGACDRFGQNGDPVTYAEIAPLLRRLNRANNNNLFLNLMTVCCSIYQLTFFNHQNDRIFNTLIGSVGGSFVEGSILHSARLNSIPAATIRNEIEHLNDQLSDGRHNEIRELTTYHVVNLQNL